MTCGETKPLEAFNLRRVAPEGRQPRSRDCCKAWYLENRERHVAKVGARSRRVRDDYRARIVDHLLEHPCVDCAERDVRVLEFDHRPGTQKRGDIARLVHELVAWQVILDEISKCDVRCANCHRRRTSERGHWWKQRVHERAAAEWREEAAARLRRMCQTSA